MDSAGSQALTESFAEAHPDSIEREREEDAYTLRCEEAHNSLLAIQERNRKESGE